jgi:hypothetical protein
MLSLLLLAACAAPSVIDVDRDGDGYSGVADCDNGDATRHPGAYDALGDGVDQDCDGVDGPDADGDGYVGSDAGGDDCDDSRADVYPGAADAWYDGVDADCAGDSDYDADDDGHDALSGGGQDCDDTDATIHPGAGEHCDGVDEDCDGTVDDHATDAETFYADGDGDGYGDGPVIEACAISAGQAETGNDCDDADPTIHPNAADACGDGIDSDCVANHPACGLWEDGDAGDADATFYGTIGSAGVGRDVGGGQDLTGDGANDVMVGVSAAANGETAVAIFAGPSPGSATVDDADVRIVQASMSDAGDRGWTCVVVTPDLTGDGEPDVFIGNPDVGDHYEGLANFYSAPFTGDRESDAPDVGVVPQSHEELGRYFAAPGDLTGDGVDDFVVTSEDFQTETLVFAGPIDASVTTADAVGTLSGAWPSSDIAEVGVGLAGGDVNGDGIADLITGTEDDESFLFFGPLDGARTDEEADGRFVGESLAGMGCDATVSADQDGDGYAEVVVGACGFFSQQVYVFDGPFGGDRTPADAEAEIQSEDDDDELGQTTASLDLDGDGAADLAVGAYGHDTGFDGTDDGYLLVYYGPLRGTIALLDADVALHGDANDQYFGCRAASAGDVDADGFPDLLVGADCGSWATTAPGFATLWYGGPGE